MIGARYEVPGMCKKGSRPSVLAAGSRGTRAERRLVSVIGESSSCSEPPTFVCFVTFCVKSLFVSLVIFCKKIRWGTTSVFAFLSRLFQ
jgi:hypothetical protein